jgi:protein-tyrosine phosphatase
MDRITESLYVGDLQDAGNPEGLREAPLTAVLKLSHSAPAEPYPEDLPVREVPLIDGPQNNYEEFDTAVNQLLDLLADDHVVFVHCAAGASRSVSVAAAALALRRETAVENAVELIRERRPIANPHSHLREQAEAFVNGY